MESKSRPEKEQDFGLNQINCPYFVPGSMWLRLKHYMQVFHVYDCILSVQRVNLIAKLAWGLKDVGDSITLSTGHLGIVSHNILSMACTGTWSFCYMSYWSSQMC
ncbi:Large structural [Gossypium arboreum]|uniref:Large structural n=1 Tax=Gossypium arboreum TaxID=29729 RepID=A0A0B0N553_GOSAR|nr:Large structural [Gossypium arboreum]